MPNSEENKIKLSIYIYMLTFFMFTFSDLIINNFSTSVHNEYLTLYITDYLKNIEDIEYLKNVFNLKILSIFFIIFSVVYFFKVSGYSTRNSKLRIKHSVYFLFPLYILYVFYFNKFGFYEKFNSIEFYLRIEIFILFFCLYLIHIFKDIESSVFSFISGLYLSLITLIYTYLENFKYWDEFSFSLLISFAICFGFFIYFFSSLFPKLKNEIKIYSYVKKDKELFLEYSKINKTKKVSFLLIFNFVFFVSFFILTMLSLSFNLFIGLLLSLIYFCFLNFALIIKKDVNEISFEDYFLMIVFLNKSMKKNSEKEIFFEKIQKKMLFKIKEKEKIAKKILKNIKEDKKVNINKFNFIKILDYIYEDLNLKSEIKKELQSKLSEINYFESELYDYLFDLKLKNKSMIIKSFSINKSVDAIDLFKNINNQNKKEYSKYFITLILKQNQYNEIEEIEEIRNNLLKIGIVLNSLNIKEIQKIDNEINAGQTRVNLIKKIKNQKIKNQKLEYNLSGAVIKNSNVNINGSELIQVNNIKGESNE